MMGNAECEELTPTIREGRMLAYLTEITAFARTFIKDRLSDTTDVSHSSCRVSNICVDGKPKQDVSSIVRIAVNNRAVEYILFFSRNLFDTTTPQMYDDSMMKLMYLSITATIRIYTGNYEGKRMSLHNNVFYRYYLLTKLFRIIPEHPTFEQVYFAKEQEVEKDE